MIDLALRDSVTEFCDLVALEVERAAVKHPRSNDPSWTTRDRWFSIWAEEIVEAMQAWNDRVDDTAIRLELVQVAAMSMRLWRSLDAG